MAQASLASLLCTFGFCTATWPIKPAAQNLFTAETWFLWTLFSCAWSCYVVRHLTQAGDPQKRVFRMGCDFGSSRTLPIRMSSRSPVAFGLCRTLYSNDTDVLCYFSILSQVIMLSFNFLIAIFLPLPLEFTTFLQCYIVQVLLQRVW